MTVLDMPTNGATHVQTWRDEVAKTVREEVDQLAARVGELTEALAQAKTELKDAQSVLRTVDADYAPAPKQSQGRSKNAGKRRTTQAGRETMSKLAAHLVTLPPREQFTALEVLEAMGNPWSSPSMYELFKVLRADELIGKGAKDPSTKRQSWRVLDLEGLQQLADIDG